MFVRRASSADLGKQVRVDEEVAFDAHHVDARTFQNLQDKIMSQGVFMHVDVTFSLSFQ